MVILQVKKIQDGATLGIYSPSEPVVEKRKEKLKSGIQILQQQGFVVVLGDNTMAHTAYTAGSIAQRVDDIHRLVSRPDVDALMASWGGKSCNQLIRHLNYDLIASAGKAILGFSDAAVMLNSITAKTGLVTFYGPNVVGKLDETNHFDLGLLKSNTSANLLGDVVTAEARAIRKGIANGKLIGGNLSTFVLGVVCSDIDNTYYDGSILFWEDMSNTAQFIDQYMTAMLNRGIFNRISGLIIGDFITKDEKEWKVKDDFQSILEILSPFQFPILYSPTFGHKKLENPILPIGAACRLDADKCTLTLTEQILK